MDTFNVKGRSNDKGSITDQEKRAIKGVFLCLTIDCTCALCVCVYRGSYTWAKGGHGPDNNFNNNNVFITIIMIFINGCGKQAHPIFNSWLRLCTVYTCNSSGVTDLLWVFLDLLASNDSRYLYM